MVGYIWQSGSVIDCYHNGTVISNGGRIIGGVVGNIHTGGSEDSNTVLIQNHFEQDGKYYVDVSVPHKEGQLIARSDKGNIVDTYLYKDNLGQTYFSGISRDSAKKSSGIDSSLLYS